jgi:hypothetical protein
MNTRLAALSLAVIALVAPLAHAQKVKIEIRAGWQGLAPSRHNKLVIKGVSGEYHASGTTVESAAVDAFLAALREPPSPAISADACGINERWITANEGHAFELLTSNRPQKPSPAQAEFFRSQFTVAKVQTYLDSLKDIIVMDDDTDIEVKATVDGDLTLIRSGSDLQFLLPWRDTEGQHKNFNCRISTTLGALLPPTFLNQQRLVLDSPRFLQEAARSVISGREDDWDRLGPHFYAN